MLARLRLAVDIKSILFWGALASVSVIAIGVWKKKTASKTPSLGKGVVACEVAGRGFVRYAFSLNPSLPLPREGIALAECSLCLLNELLPSRGEPHNPAAFFDLPDNLLALTLTGIVICKLHSRLAPAMQSILF
jgi:hypothetical protein